MQVTVRKVVEVKASADDWGLYYTPEREEVASALNEKFSILVEMGRDRDDVEHYMLKFMEVYASDGAYDTEPRAVLDKILDEVFSIDHIL